MMKLRFSSLSGRREAKDVGRHRHGERRRGGVDLGGEEQNHRSAGHLDRGRQRADRIGCAGRALHPRDVR